MSVKSNYTAFAALSGAFVEDMARDLELDLKQVRHIEVEDYSSLFKHYVVVVYESGLRKPVV